MGSMMTYGMAADRSNGRYGPLGFAVTLLHILVVDGTTWMFMPYSIVLVLPAVLGYMTISAVVARGQGRVGQVGRGMFLGSLSAPLSLVIFALAWAIAKTIGPL